MKLDILQGKTSKRTVIFIQDSTSTTGAGLTGLAFGSAGLTWYYWREDTGNANGVSVTLATATRGTWATGGFIEIDATNLPGFYEIGIPNAALASGATWVVMMLKGAANMMPLALEIQLTAYDPYSATNLGLSALPTVAPAANGGLPTVDASNGVTIKTQQLLVKKNFGLANFQFPMFDVTGAGKTGLTITAQRSIDGAAFGACANSASEISNGWYVISLVAADLNGTCIALRFSGTGALDTDFTLITQP